MNTKSRKKRRELNGEHIAFHLMLLVPVVLLVIYHLLPIPPEY